MSNIFVWCDIPVKNLDRATAFYGAMLGAKLDVVAMGEMKFAMLPHAESHVSGCLAEMADSQPSLNGPLVYLNCEGRLDDAIAAAEKSGGTVLKARHPIGEHGFRAIIADTEGNRVALHSR